MNFTKSKNIVRSCLLMSACAFSVTSNTANAEIGEVSVDGEVVHEILFSAYKNIILQDPDYCHPYTDRYVIEKVVDRILIRNKARALRLERDEQIDQIETDTSAQLAALPANATESERENMALMVLSIESDGYGSTLFEENNSFDVKKSYLEMLENDDPLVVNVPTMRLASMEFNALSDAQNAADKVAGGGDFDTIAAELNIDSYLYEDNKLLWQHKTAVPVLSDAKVETESVIGPYYKQRKWVLSKVLETKSLPVAVLTDVIDGKYNTISSYLTNHLTQSNREEVIAKLRAAAKIEMDGELITSTDIPEYCTEARF